VHRGGDGVLLVRRSSALHDLDDLASCCRMLFGRALAAAGTGLVRVRTSRLSRLVHHRIVDRDRPGVAGATGLVKGRQRLKVLEDDSDDLLGRVLATDRSLGHVALVHVDRALRAARLSRSPWECDAEGLAQRVANVAVKRPEATACAHREQRPGQS